MRIYYAFESVPIEQPRVREHGAKGYIPNPLAQRAAEPACERHGKPHLWPIQDLPRQPPFGGLLQQEFTFATADLQIRRQGSEPFDEKMIHQRLTHFERVRHARPIHLRIDVPHEVGLEIEVLNEGERIIRPGALRIPVEQLVDAVPAEL